MSTTAYVVTSEARGVARFASTSRTEALEWAQGHADADLAAQPNQATPHYVVTAWHADGATEDMHVYASRNGQPHPLTTVADAPEVPGSVLRANIVYCTYDQFVCVECCGYTARVTGIDIDGHRLRVLTAQDVAEWPGDLPPIWCGCGKVSASSMGLL